MVINIFYRQGLFTKMKLKRLLTNMTWKMMLMTWMMMTSEKFCQSILVMIWT